MVLYNINKDCLLCWEYTPQETYKPILNPNYLTKTKPHTKQLVDKKISL